MNKEIITVVSGLPRSGTSMMMKVLEAGGMKIMADKIRKADEDNPKGYYEFEKVKELEKDSSWLKDARGEAVKIISPLLEHLPDKYSYKIIFMRRNMEEILKSQKQMLVRRGEPTDEVSDETMGTIFSKHLQKVEDKLRIRQNVEILNINYNEVLKEPAKNIEAVNRFLGNTLDINSMMKAIDQTLYRQQGKS